MKWRAVNEHQKAYDPTLEPPLDELRAEVDRLRAALEKHHDLLSDEPGDICRTCDLDYLGNHRLPTNT